MLQQQIKRFTDAVVYRGSDKQLARRLWYSQMAVVGWLLSNGAVVG